MLFALAELTLYRKSYRAGLLQAKAFRVLKKRTNDVLAPHSLSATEWGVLGLLIDAPQGIVQKKLAAEVGVKPPFMTRSVAGLQKQGLVAITIPPEDSRLKIITITKKGSSFVQKIEKEVVAMLADTFAGISYRDRIGYVKTLMALTHRYGDKIIDTTDLNHMRDE